MSKVKNAYYLELRTKDLNSFLEDTGYSYIWRSEYHVSIWIGINRFDFYPTSGKYYNISINHWSKYDSLEDIYRITNEV